MCGLVEFPEREDLQLNDIGGNYNVYQYNGADLQLSVLDLLDSLSVNRHTCFSCEGGDNGVDRHDSITASYWKRPIIFSTASDSEEVAVIQLDRVSSCFNNIDSYGNVTAVTASDYNHRLATWAMELSYAAYNYSNGEELPIIPGAFMGDFVKSANTLLSENGFVNITDLNYGSNESGAHTIGWRPIGGVDTGLLQISDDIGGNDNVGWDNTSDEELYVWNFLDRLRTLDGNSGRADSRNVAVLAGKDNVVDVIQSSAIRTMPLVVVDVRGTVTVSDWINDVMT